MKALFDSTSQACSELVTKAYSTSFSLGIKFLGASVQPAVYSIYGFVRYADEIVDTFLEYDQKELFYEFKDDYKKSLDRRISLNPILNAFQKVVHDYQLYDLVESFLESMEMDLEKKEYKTKEEYEKYIYGSADVVGLMCLKVFVQGDTERYEALKGEAMKLGSAFQKVNFLRDLKDDVDHLGRSYFPDVTSTMFNTQVKEQIVQEIESDFAEAYKGILKLPIDGKMGVYLAYRYYLTLLKKIKQTDTEKLFKSDSDFKSSKSCYLDAFIH
jgi:Phytoene/squalene synthetase